MITTAVDPSDNALIARWAIDAELDLSRQEHFHSTGRSRTRDSIQSPSLMVTSDPAMADQQLFRAPPA